MLLFQYRHHCSSSALPWALWPSVVVVVVFVISAILLKTSPMNSGAASLWMMLGLPRRNQISSMSAGTSVRAVRSGRGITKTVLVNASMTPMGIRTRLAGDAHGHGTPPLQMASGHF